MTCLRLHEPLQVRRFTLGRVLEQDGIGAKIPGISLGNASQTCADVLDRFFVFRD